MSLTEFDQEEYDRNRREEGYKEGAEQKALEAALLLIEKYGVSPETAAKDMKIELDKLAGGYFSGPLILAL